MVNATSTTPTARPNPVPAGNLREQPKISTPGQKPNAAGKGFPIKYVVGAIVVALLIVGSAVGFILSQQSQDVRQQAAVAPPGGVVTTQCNTVQKQAECFSQNLSFDAGNCSCFAPAPQNLIDEIERSQSAPPGPSNLGGGGTTTTGGGGTTTTGGTTQTTSGGAVSTGGGGGGGTSALATTTQKSCGSACSSDSECRTPANGGTAVCRNGICENRECPTGKTLPGANCDCSVAGRLCGQTCGASVGLCGDGISTCRFLSGAACTGNEFNSQTVCVPNKVDAGQVTGWKNTLCSVGGNQYTTFNNQNPTQAQVQQACLAVTAVCGNGSVESVTGEQCDLGTAQNGKPEANCSSDCKLKQAQLAQAAVAASPTPTPSPTPSATPTLVYTCNSVCTTDAQCQTANADYLCSSGKCRLKSNLTSETCTGMSCNSACSTSDQCQAVNANYTCYNGKCRLSDNPAATNCQLPASQAPIPVSGNTEMTFAILAAGIFFLLGGTFVINRQRQ